MSAVLMCVATVLLGVDVGWQPLPKGGVEYIIQIEPGTVESLRPGEAIESSIPPEVRDVRAYRIVVGKEKLPKTLPAKSSEPATESPPKTPDLGTVGRSPLLSGAAPFMSPKPDKSSGAPSALPSNPGSKPLAGQQALYVEQSGDAAKSEPKQHLPASAEPEKSWPAFWAVLLGLFASLTGNVYLGWIFWDVRKRYQDVLTVCPQGSTS